MKNILVVDDDQQVRKMLRMTLEREGYNVCEAEDGAAAMAIYQAGSVDLVITDIVMPEQEGIGLIMELKNQDSAVRIIAISGGGRMDAGTYLKWARRLGVEHTFTKPVGRKDMLSAVTILFENAPVSCATIS